MTSEERKQALESIVANNNPVATGHLLTFQGVTRGFDVYNIPMDLLLYNPYNGRIGSVAQTFEKQDHVLDPSNPSDAKQIEKFLWESKLSANQKTEESLKRYGQLKFGIVTAEGIIIDGNRRASIMNRIRKSPSSSTDEKARCEYFKAVILPPAQKKEILQLETSYQMGEDAKVDYNPIEKYLKCEQLKSVGYFEDDIAEMMSIKKSEVVTYLEILDLMKDYLSTYGYDGIYALAAGHEDSFIKLHSALKGYNSGVSTMWDYKKKDINDLKLVAFDYIRLNLPQNDIRDIFLKPTNTRNSIFGSKEIWNSFLEEHNRVMDSVAEVDVDDYRAQSNEPDLVKCLQARDADWRKQVNDKLESNFDSGKDAINSIQQAKQPLILLNKALAALNSIDQNADAFVNNESEIVDKLSQIIDIAQGLKSN